MRFTDNPFRVARQPDEGRPATPDAIAALRTKVNDLTGDARTQLITWAKEADEAKCSFRPSHNPSLRRFELSRAAWRCVTTTLTPDWTMRAALTVILGEDQMQTHPTGALMGSCNADEAQRLAHLLDTWAYPSSTDTPATGDTAA